MPFAINYLACRIVLLTAKFTHDLLLQRVKGRPTGHPTIRTSQLNTDSEQAFIYQVSKRVDWFQLCIMWSRLY